MAGLKLGKIGDAATDLRVSLVFKGALAKQLNEYLAAYNAENSSSVAMPELVGAMVEQFIAADSGFRTHQRKRRDTAAGTNSTKSSAS